MWWINTAKWNLAEKQTEDTNRETDLSLKKHFNSLLNVPSKYIIFVIFIFLKDYCGDIYLLFTKLHCGSGKIWIL